MLSVNMYSLWKDDTSNIIKGIGEATNNIVNYRHSLNVTEKKVLRTYRRCSGSL